MNVGIYTLYKLLSSNTLQLVFYRFPAYINKYHNSKNQPTDTILQILKFRIVLYTIQYIKLLQIMPPLQTQSIPLYLVNHFLSKAEKYRRTYYDYVQF